MLAVHWSPVKNTQKILRNGIRLSKRRNREGVFCFPLTGHFDVDRMWPRYLGGHKGIQYNGLIFRIAEIDLPARFADCYSDLFGDVPWFKAMDELEAAYRSTIIYRIGLEWGKTDRNKDDLNFDELKVLGEQLVQEDPKLFSRCVRDPTWLYNAIDDYEIVLSKPIDAKRIIRTVSGGQQSGRQRVRKMRVSTEFEE